MKSAFKVDDPQFFMLKIRENSNHFFFFSFFRKFEFLRQNHCISARCSVEFKVDY